MRRTTLAASKNFGSLLAILFAILALIPRVHAQTSVDSAAIYKSLKDAADLQKLKEEAKFRGFRNKVVKAGQAITVYQVYSEDTGKSMSKGFARVLNDNYYISITPTHKKFMDLDKGDSAEYYLFYVPGNKIEPNPNGVKTAGINLITKPDWGRYFWISADYIDEYMEDFTPVSKDKWSLNLTTIPFKYRWSYKGGQSAFTGECTIGPSFSYRFSSDAFGNVLSFTGGIGYTILNKSLLSDTASASTTTGNTTSGAVSVHLGISAAIKKVSVSVFYGYDFTDNNYIYNQKPWLSVGISGQIATLATYLNAQK